MAFNFLNKDGLTYFWNKIKARIGTATLTTTAQDLSGAVNELNSNLNEMVKIVTLSTSFTLVANETNTFNYTSGSIPTGYTYCCAFPLTTGNVKVIVRYANSVSVGLINLNTSSVSGTVNIGALCIKSHLIS